MDRLANHCQAVILHNPRACGTEPPLPRDPYGASGNALHAVNMKHRRRFVNHPFQGLSARGADGWRAAPAQGARGLRRTAVGPRSRSDRQGYGMTGAWPRRCRAGATSGVGYLESGDGSEVDVLYGAAGFYAIEVKNGRSLRLADFRAIKAFHRDYPESDAAAALPGQRDPEAGRCALHTGRPLPARACPGPRSARLTAALRGNATSQRAVKLGGRRGGRLGRQASATSKAVRLRVARLNSTPIR